MKKHRRLEKPPLDLLEQATHLVRLAPGSVLAAYFAGSLPFVMGMLYFWADMSRSAFAYSRVVEASLGMALLFVWMKCWHAVFARQLRAQITGRDEPRWTAGRVARLVLVQTALQSSGLFAIPIALLIMLPFGWVYAFYQTVTAIGGADSESPGAVFRKARLLCALWPLQNHVIIFILSLFALFVWINVAAALAGIPSLLKMLLGIETVFTTLGMALILNSTFLAATFALAYLCIDPLIKAIYVLRCFHGESVQSGEDLKAELRHQLSEQAAGAPVRP